ncbi:3-oxoacyl-ACP reductase [Paenibacillus sp. FSL H8-0548]|uniref:SDR family oxidoreductase n=1 Tax=Paenibacillus sp. FSL H8-0548 TaxID=1920422 RepID=UPI00096D8FE3|nr:SDR family oxidoreductase [Paenibacillus sp. FSL H8-0548]OMF28102.1 3-oxoacyl-ACP reductase [Paenibacillus sp. FSL H8-0548]
MGLNGKTALVTGSAKGLGKRTALQLAERGCNVVINYYESELEARQVQAQIEQLGVKAITVQADIATTEGAAKLADAAESWAGGVDILVNNAGPFVRKRRLFSEYDEDTIIRLLHGNLLGVMLLDHRLLPGMRERKWGRIVHFGFGHAGEARAWPHRAVYAAAKTGLVSFTKSLAVEEAPHGITVNLIGPGDIRGVNKERSIAEVEEEYDNESPIGRPGAGEDVARVVLFLCDIQSNFLTGNVIDVTGGFDPIVANIKGMF